MKNFICSTFIIIVTVSIIACNAFEHDTIKEIATQQTLDENLQELQDIETCGVILTCNYYLDTPCVATCWHNTWDARDRECKKMGSFNCRWSFPGPWIMGGTCYCCNLKCR